MTQRVPPPIQIAFAVAALSLVTLSGCGQSGAPVAARSDAPPREVRVVPVERRPIELMVEVTGTLYGEEEIEVSAEVSGRLSAIHADLGDTVPHGGLLARISPTDFELSVSEQEAALKAALAKVGLDALPSEIFEVDSLPVVERAIAQESNAQARLERARRLYDRDPPLISEQDFADIRTQYEVASTSAAVERLNARSLLADARVRASQLRIAQERLADTRIIAPNERQLTYRVAARLASVGEVVTEGRPLYRLVASDRVKFRGQVPERFASQVRAGARAWLVVEGFADRFEAVVARVAPAVDVPSRSFAVEIEAENEGARLKPGSFGRAVIVTGIDQDARFVPDSAVVRFAGVQRVFSVKEGKAVEHRITAGQAINGVTQVLSPLDGVDAVIDDPKSLRAGSAVTVTSEP